MYFKHYFLHLFLYPRPTRPRIARRCADCRGDKHKRKTGVLASVGALGFGYNATTCFCGVNEKLGIDTTSDE